MEKEQGTLTHLLTQKHRKRLTGSWFKAPSPLSLSSGVEFQCSIFVFFFPHKGYSFNDSLSVPVCFPLLIDELR